MFVSFEMESEAKPKAKRSLVMDLLKKNTTTSIIQKTMGVNRKYVYRLKKCLEANVGPQRKPGSGRPRSVRTRPLIKAVNSKVRRNPVRSINKLAKEHNVARSTMQQIIKKDLGLKPFKMQKRQLLSEATKTKRLERAKILKKWFAQNPKVVVIYSDEKLFDIEKKFNVQNTRVLSKDINTVDPSNRFVYKRQKPASVMIWAAVASNGKKSPIFVIPDGVKINQEVYLDFLKTEVKPWIDSEFCDVEICFTQDSAPAHGAKRVQAWCAENFQHFWPKEYWPPSSPDCNPLDFAM
jgi:hypothetical protein